MDVLTTPVNVWNKDSIRPGAVGSVGDVLQGVRLKQSSIELPPRYDKQFSGPNIVYLGSNVSDGYHAGFTTGGGVARTITKRMPYRQGFKTPIGWVMEDIVAEDRSRTSLMGSAGQYSWDAKVGKINRAKNTGEFFKPLPGGYALADGVTPRGSNIPRIVAESTGEGNALPPTEVKVTDPLFGEGGSIPNPTGNQPGGDKWVQVWDYPELIGLTWIPDWVSKDGNTPLDTHYKYYVETGIVFKDKWFPKNDPTIQQEVWERPGIPTSDLHMRFSPFGLIERPERYPNPEGQMIEIGEPPHHWVIDGQNPNTPVGGPIAKPGGWRDKKPEKKPGEKTPTKFMGINSKRVRIR